MLSIKPLHSTPDTSERVINAASDLLHCRSRADLKIIGGVVGVHNLSITATFTQNRLPETVRILIDGGDIGVAGIHCGIERKRAEVFDDGAVHGVKNPIVRNDIRFFYVPLEMIPVKVHDTLADPGALLHKALGGRTDRSQGNGITLIASVMQNCETPRRLDPAIKVRNVRIVGVREIIIPLRVIELEIRLAQIAAHTVLRLEVLGADRKDNGLAPPTGTSVPLPGTS